MGSILSLQKVALTRAKQAVDGIKRIKMKEPTKLAEIKISIIKVIVIIMVMVMALDMALAMAMALDTKIIHITRIQDFLLSKM